MNVNIAGLNKADVLLALYNNALFAMSNPSARALAILAGNGQRELAERLIASGTTYFDYINLGAGPRPLKVDLSQDNFDPFLYERDHGQAGYAATIVQNLRRQLSSPSMFQAVEEEKVEITRLARP